MKKINQKNYLDFIFSGVICILTIIIALIPLDKYYKTQTGNYEARGVVLATNNAAVFQHGLVRQGEQEVEVKVLDGAERGKTLKAVNLLQGATELEWFYQIGEKVIIGYTKNDGQIVGARMLEPVRDTNITIILGVFFILLLSLAGWTGIKAMLSFVFTMMVIWKIMLPLYLENQFDPVMLAIIIVAVLCFVIIFLVAGFTKKGWAAFWGAFGSCIFTWLILLFCGGSLKINGATAHFAMALKFSGFESLNLLRLFYAAVILSASGAIMDIAMDIAASMSEIKEKRPEIGRYELIQSGFNIGKVVIGTMTTTLLLAYSGGTLTMLMYFLAKGISLSRIINTNYFAAEILKTVSGTIGLTMAIPCTVLVAGVMMVPIVKKERILRGVSEIHS